MTGIASLVRSRIAVVLGGLAFLFALSAPLAMAAPDCDKLPTHSEAYQKFCTDNETEQPDEDEESELPDTESEETEEESEETESEETEETETEESEETETEETQEPGSTETDDTTQGASNTGPSDDSAPSGDQNDKGKDLPGAVSLGAPSDENDSTTSADDEDAGNEAPATEDLTDQATPEITEVAADATEPPLATEQSPDANRTPWGLFTALGLGASGLLVVALRRRTDSDA